VSSCAFRKKTGELNKLGKLYHNTTSHYNGYFNANVLLEESILSLETKHTDNYNEILPIYKYTAVDDATSVNNNLDQAIEKVSIVVNLHAESDWVDDCYWMVGQAQFVKQDYESAEETMEYFKEHFDPKNPKPRKVAPKKRAKRSRTSNRTRTSTRSKSEKSGKSKSAKQKNRERKKANKERKKKIKERKKQSKKKKNSKQRVAKSKTERQKKELAEKEKIAQNLSDEVANKAEAKIKGPKPEKEDKYFMKHKPAYQKGLLLLAKSYIEREKFTRAESILKDLENTSGLFNETIKEIPVVYAYRHLEQNNYSLAIPHLEKAIELASKKKLKARYSYILAQLYQKENRKEEAYAMFNKVSKMNSAYEMEFNARLNIERNAWAAGKSNADDILRSLKKMSKDFKNEDYKDQIYFVMAEVELSQNNRKEAIAHLLSSIESTTNNKPQLLESNYMLANLYYEDNAYVDAKNHFDMALANMPKEDDRYSFTKKLSENLTDIAANIQIIELQDSLLAISKLSEKEQKAIAAKIKGDIETEVDKGKGMLAAGGKNGNSSGLRNTAAVVGGGPVARGPSAVSTYFAYNDKSVKKGKKEFDRIWGDRDRVDDWRRSNQSGGNIDNSATEALNDEIAGVSNAEIERILKDVPKTEDEKLAANNKIMEAMYKLGTLYRDRIENYEQSVTTLENLMERYPKNEHELDAWYYLYLANIDLKNTARANYYLDLITKNYPESTIAKVLSDPSYINVTKEEDRQLQLHYNETYIAFKQGDYAQAVALSKQADSKFGIKNNLKPKFALLDAMLQGKDGNKDAYIEALKNFIANYKDTPEEKKAKEMLLLLRGNRFSTKIDRNSARTSGAFTYEPEKLHYLIVVLYNTETVSMNDAKLTIAKYNEKYHKLDKIRLSVLSLDLEAKIPLLLLRKFDNKDKVMRYYDEITKKKNEFLPSNTDFEIFPVTTKNYREIIRMHTVDIYREFFEENYQ